jgi:hypothetical protein
VPNSVIVTFTIVVILASAGCVRHKATTGDCSAILDRIIELELVESGYRDNVVRARWKGDIGRRFAPDVERCQGLAVKDDLHRCLELVRTSDEIVHNCLD